METDMDKLRKDLDDQGFLVLNEVLDGDALSLYCGLYEDFMSGKLDASDHRHDLGSHNEPKIKGRENITQIMWPSLYFDKASRPINGIHNSSLHVQAEAIAKALLGPDMAFDFDMLITKEGFTDTTTPWHSDEAYWLDLADKRALSFWFPMQDVNVDNGCMWFVPGSHKQDLRKHRPTKEGHHVLMTDDCSNDEGVPQPLKEGGCTIHTGRTLHYTGGNLTSQPRRAYIVNFRPASMIDVERKNDYDHGKAGFQKATMKGQVHGTGSLAKE